VTYRSLDDLDGFREDVEAIVDAIGREAVAFGCMDEWALAYARAGGSRGCPAPLRRDRHARRRVEQVRAVRDLRDARRSVPGDVPAHGDGGGGDGHAGRRRPDDEAAAEALGFPLVVKPELKRATSRRRSAPTYWRSPTARSSRTRSRPPARRRSP